MRGIEDMMEMQTIYRIEDKKIRRVMRQDMIGTVIFVSVFGAIIVMMAGAGANAENGPASFLFIGILTLPVIVIGIGRSLRRIRGLQAHLKGFCLELGNDRLLVYKYEQLEVQVAYQDIHQIKKTRMGFELIANGERLRFSKVIENYDELFENLNRMVEGSI
jgi:hypothetical protein